jgi:hypothetical protein
MAFKISGKKGKYRRVAAKKNGKCPSGATKVTRGRSRRQTCVVPVGTKKK